MAKKNKNVYLYIVEAMFLMLLYYFLLKIFLFNFFSFYIRISYIIDFVYKRKKKTEKKYF